MESPRWMVLAETLISRIDRGEFKRGDRLPSESELARDFGVSRQTAHRAVHELHRQGRVARRRRMGTFVSEPTRRQTGLVALLMDHTNDYPQADLVRGIQAGLGDGFRLVLVDVGDDPNREADQLDRMRRDADGVLIYPLSHAQNTPLLQELVDEGLPLVCLDRAPDRLRADAVVSDNYGATRLAMERLIAQGHRRVAFISGDNPQVSAVRERHAAWCDALGEASSPCPDLERWLPKELEARPVRLVQAVGDALLAMRSRPNPPTAVFCVQDCYAMAVLEAGDDLSQLPILTYNDWPPMMLRRVHELNRIVQNPFEIGRLAAIRLHARLRGDIHDVTVQRVPAAFYAAGSAEPIYGPQAPTGERPATPTNEG